MVRLVLLGMVVAGLVLVVLAAVGGASLAGGDPCDTEIERDPTGFVWFSACPPQECPDDVECEEVMLNNQYAMCMCAGPEPTPEGCLPAIDPATSETICFPNCPPGETCPSGTWVKRTDGSGWFDWVCPSCK